MTDPNIPQKAPHMKDIEPGTYAWCACGRSKTEPYCDGSHKGTEFKPVIVKLEVKKTDAAICGCKHTKTPPYCDGSHKDL